MSHLDIPIHEIVDSLIEDLAYCQVAFIRSQEGNNGGNDNRVYVYKYRRSAYPTLPVGSIVAVARRPQQSDAAAYDNMYRMARTKVPKAPVPEQPTTATSRRVSVDNPASEVSWLDMPSVTLDMSPSPAAILPGLAQVVTSDFEYEYDDDPDSDAKYVPWLAGVIDTSELSMCVDEERKLRTSLRSSAKKIRKAQVISSLLGDALAHIESPLLTKK